MKDKLIMAQLLISLVELDKLNLEDERRWTAKNLTLKSVDVDCEPSSMRIKVCTSLLESCIFLV